MSNFKKIFNNNNNVFLNEDINRGDENKKEESISNGNSNNKIILDDNFSEEEVDQSIFSGSNVKNCYCLGGTYESQPDAPILQLISSFDNSSQSPNKETIPNKIPSFAKLPDRFNPQKKILDTQNVKNFKTPKKNEKVKKEEEQSTSDYKLNPINTDPQSIANIPQIVNERNKTKPKRKFRFSGLNVFLTYPRVAFDKQHVLDFFLNGHYKIKEALIAQEHHKPKESFNFYNEYEEENYGEYLKEIDENAPDTHIHCWIGFDKKVDVLNPRFLDIDGRHPNIQKPKDKVAIIKYISKEDPNPLEFNFNKDSYIKAAKQKKSYAVQRYMDDEITLAELCRIDPRNFINFGRLKTAKILYKNDIEVEKMDWSRRIKAFWLYGNSGIGKTRLMQIRFPNAYRKSSTDKWWDDYQNQRVVILEDVDKTKWIGHFIKLWADNVKALVEIKGGKIIPCVDVMIVTSNFSPKDIFLTEPEDKNQIINKETRIAINTSIIQTSAIERRFKIIHFKNSINEFIKELPPCLNNVPFDYPARRSLMHYLKLNDDTTQIVLRNREKEKQRLLKIQQKEDEKTNLIQRYLEQHPNEEYDSDIDENNYNEVIDDTDEEYDGELDYERYNLIPYTTESEKLKNGYYDQFNIIDINQSPYDQVDKKAVRGFDEEYDEFIQYTKRRKKGERRPFFDKEHDYRINQKTLDAVLKPTDEIKKQEEKQQEEKLQEQFNKIKKELEELNNLKKELQELKNKENSFINANKKISQLEEELQTEKNNNNKLREILQLKPFNPQSQKTQFPKPQSQKPKPQIKNLKRNQNNLNNFFIPNTETKKFFDDDESMKDFIASDSNSEFLNKKTTRDVINSFKGHVKKEKRFIQPFNSKDYLKKDSDLDDEIANSEDAKKEDVKKDEIKKTLRHVEGFIDDEAYDFDEEEESMHDELTEEDIQRENEKKQKKKKN